MDQTADLTLTINGKKITLKYKLHFYVKNDVRVLNKNGAELIVKEHNAATQTELVANHLLSNGYLIVFKTLIGDSKNEHYYGDGIGSGFVSFNELNLDTVINTMTKMAKKRSYVDAVLSSFKLSNLFTQDLDETEKTMQYFDSKEILANDNVDEQNNVIVPEYSFGNDPIEPPKQDKPKRTRKPKVMVEEVNNIAPPAPVVQPIINEVEDEIEEVTSFDWLGGPVNLQVAPQIDNNLIDVATLEHWITNDKDKVKELSKIFGVDNAQKLRSVLAKYGTTNIVAIPYEAKQEIIELYEIRRS